MKPQFLSHELCEETPAYGNGPSLKIISKREIGQDSQSRSQVWQFSNHVGTHMDFPAHFVRKGRNISEYAAEDFCFNKVAMISLPVQPGRLILPDDIKWPSNIASRDLLLFKTGFEKHRSRQSYVLQGPGFHPDTCIEILKRAKKLRAIGFDFISLTSYQHREAGREAHRILLGRGNGLFIVEDMHLSKLKRSPQNVWLAPLRVQAADGSPVTVIANL